MSVKAFETLFRCMIHTESRFSKAVSSRVLPGGFHGCWMGSRLLIITVEIYRVAKWRECQPEEKRRGLYSGTAVLQK